MPSVGYSFLGIFLDSYFFPHYVRIIDFLAQGQHLVVVLGGKV